MKDCDRYLMLMSRQLDGDLSEEEQGELFAHLKQCPNCSARFEVYKIMTQALSELESEPPEKMAQGVMYKIEKDAKKGILGRHMLPFTGIAAVAAAILLILSGVFGDIRLLGFRSGAPAMSMSASDSAPAAAVGGSAGSAPARQQVRKFAAEVPDGKLESGKAPAPAPAPEASASPGDDFGGGANMLLVPADGEAAPAVPFSRTFSSIVEISGAEDGLFPQDPHEQVSGQTYIFVPSKELEDFIGQKHAESMTVTVYREGSSIDPAADTGLVILIQ